MFVQCVDFPLGFANEASSIKQQSCFTDAWACFIDPRRSFARWYPFETNNPWRLWLPTSNFGFPFQNNIISTEGRDPAHPENRIQAKTIPSDSFSNGVCHDFIAESNFGSYRRKTSPLSQWIGFRAARHHPPDPPTRDVSPFSMA